MDEPTDDSIWERALSLLESLLELPPDRRGDLLSDSSIPEEVRDLVSRLLAAHARDSGPLEKAPQLPGAAPPIVDALENHRFGRWRLQREIGRGGMAVVYSAISLEAPLGQEAAVKVLTLGAQAAGGRERLLRERQFLARLRHPYIAPLYDAGIADDGTPWLAMALVAGERIDDWCDRQRLTAERRVELVLQVADAVAYAHRNLVIHRDIKPSNVLVDESGHVRLLDFGIAKLNDALEPGEQTVTAMRALTPEYASPEQFAGAAPSTAMDVYGLGALLYRVLAGQPPRPQDRQAASILPSRAVLQSAGLTQAERRQWARRLRGDLDTIVMKALTREPARRYASVTAFAEDLRRWRDRKPIEARAPSIAYTTGRFIARNPVAAALAAGLLLSLAGGLAISLKQTQQARQESARARAAENAALQQSAFLRNLLAMIGPSNSDVASDRLALLEAADKQAQDALADQPAALANVKLTLGDAFLRMSERTRAAQLYGQALVLDRKAEPVPGVQRARIHAARGALLALEDGNLPTSSAEYEQALSIVRKMRPTQETVFPEAFANYATALADEQAFDRAQAVLAEGGQRCRAAPVPGCFWLDFVVGRIGLQRGDDLDSAQAAFERAYAQAGKVPGFGQTDRIELLTGLATAYLFSGRTTEALPLLEQAADLHQRIYGRATPESAKIWGQIAKARLQANRLDEAMAAAQTALQQYRAIEGDVSSNVAGAMIRVGSVLRAQGRLREYESINRQAYHVAGKVGSPQAAVAASSVGGSLIAQKKPADALVWLRRAAELNRAAGGEGRTYAIDLMKMGRAEYLQNRLDDSRGHLDQALKIFVATSAAKDFAPSYGLASRAQTRYAQGERKQALIDIDEALAGLTAAMGPQNSMRLEALSWAVELHCRDRSGRCTELRAEAQAMLDKGAPPNERALLEKALGQVPGKGAAVRSGATRG